MGLAGSVEPEWAAGPQRTWADGSSRGETTGLPGRQARLCGELGQLRRAGACGKARHGVEDGRELSLGFSPRAHLTRTRKGGEVGGRRDAQDLHVAGLWHRLLG